MPGGRGCAEIEKVHKNHTMESFCLKQQKTRVRWPPEKAHPNSRGSGIFSSKPKALAPSGQLCGPSALSATSAGPTRRPAWAPGHTRPREDRRDGAAAAAGPRGQAEGRGADAPRPSSLSAGAPGCCPLPGVPAGLPGTGGGRGAGPVGLLVKLRRRPQRQAAAWPRPSGRATGH